MLSWLHANRLKVISALCIVGDMLMGLAGAVGLYHAGKNFADLLLTIAGGLGLFGHAIVIIWGKGGGGATSGTSAKKDRTSALVKSLLMWRYPLDSSFAVFAVGGLCFAVSGAASKNPLLAAFGIICSISSLIGWLWPQDKRLFGFRSLQVCATLYMTSGVSNLASGLWAHSSFIVLAGCCYILANIILYTVRKEHQSEYTIESG